jgi:hypothetical protein
MAQIQSASRDGLIVCTCGAKEYTVRDVIDAALFRGELESTWQEFLRNVEAEKRAKESHLEMDLDAIEEMAEQFRYDHDLITAEETEQWLDQRGLTLEDFTNYFARRHWRMAFEDVSPEDLEFISASAQLRDAFTIDLIFADELHRLVKQFLWRLAAHAADGEHDVHPGEIDAERAQFLDRLQLTQSKIKTWLDRIRRDQEWLNSTMAMEAVYRRMKKSVVNPDARKKQLAMLRMPLTRFEAEVIEFESLEAAKEALLCIQQDGLSMEEIAADARYPYRQITFCHEEVPPELQQKFWSVGPGSVLSPLRRGDGFELYRITNKIEPDLTDPVVQEQVDVRLLERHFSHLVRDHVEPRLQAGTRSE